MKDFFISHNKADRLGGINCPGAEEEKYSAVLQSWNFRPEKGARFSPSKSRIADQKVFWLH